MKRIYYFILCAACLCCLFIICALLKRTGEDTASPAPANSSARRRSNGAEQGTRKDLKKEIKVPPDKMNPYPFSFFRRTKAEQLKYPPGIDTVAYWGNGRFAIIVNYFKDLKAGGGGADLRGNYSVSIQETQGVLQGS